MHDLRQRLGGAGRSTAERCFNRRRMASEIDSDLSDAR